MAIDQHTFEPVDWRDGGTPHSRRFNDVYFDTVDGLGEARHVFLSGNGLPQRFAPGFRIAELGFGTGLNMLAALHCWRQSGNEGPLRYTAFEAFPLCVADMRRALLPFPDLSSVAAGLFDAMQTGGNAVELPWLTLTVIAGDARETVPHWDGEADAWFLDGFSPSRNPELWEPGLMASVAGKTAPGGTFATYSAAGLVRRSLADAGFRVARRPGFGRKRHMCCGSVGTGG